MKKPGLMARLRRYVLRNFWEGAVRWSPNRSSLPEETPRDARQDLSAWDLQELIRKNRYFSKNGPAVYIRLQSLFAQYTVGTEGIKIVPASSDIEFNTKLAEAWGEACQNLEISGKSYAKASEEGACTLFSDGGFFIVKSSKEAKSGAGSPSKVPKIWLVERQRVVTPQEKWDQEGKTFFNGIELDPTQSFPIRYWIRKGDKIDPYEAKDVEHVFDSTRPGQLDGIPILAPATNLLNDLFDLTALQMKKAKDAAEKSTFVFGEAGEFTDEEAMRTTESVATEDSTGTETTEDRVRKWREAHGGSWTLFPDTVKDAKQFKSESPSVTEQWHWRKVEAEVCAIAGSSIQLVFPESLQGTVQRGDIDVVAASYRGWSCLQGEHWGNVYLWWLEWAVRNDPRLKNKPEDYKKFETRPPRGPDVDVGRNSKADIEEIKNLCQTREAYYARRQKDWRREISQSLNEAVFIKEEAKKRGLTLDEAMKILSLEPEEPSNVPPKKEKKDDEE